MSLLHVTAVQQRVWRHNVSTAHNSSQKGVMPQHFLLHATAAKRCDAATSLLHAAAAKKCDAGSAGTNVSSFAGTGAHCPHRRLCGANHTWARPVTRRFTVDPTNLWINNAWSTACSDLRVAYRDPAPVIHIVRTLWPYKPTWINELPQRLNGNSTLWSAGCRPVSFATRPYHATATTRPWSTGGDGNPTMAGSMHFSRCEAGLPHTSKTPWHSGQRTASTAIRPIWSTGGRNGNLTIPWQSHPMRSDPATRERRPLSLVTEHQRKERQRLKARQHTIAGHTENQPNNKLHCAHETCATTKTGSLQDDRNPPVSFG